MMIYIWRNSHASIVVFNIDTKTWSNLPEYGLHFASHGSFQANGKGHVKDTRSDIKIKSELIIDLGSVKSVNKIKAILGKFDNSMKYESEYSVYYSKDNVSYKLLYTAAPTDVSTEEYTNMSQKLIVLPEILDTRYIDAFYNDGSYGPGSGN